jgi:16S rRNA (guanine527-N7)-methyltransferase
VLAIVCPWLDVTLVDKVQKKVAFLVQVQVDLGLHNVRPRHGRIESLAPAPGFDVVTSRAFASLSDFVRLTRHALAPRGQWLAMKGRLAQAELAELPDDVELMASVPLTVPHLQEVRHLLRLRPRGAGLQT